MNNEKIIIVDLEIKQGKTKNEVWFMAVEDRSIIDVVCRETDSIEEVISVLTNEYRGYDIIVNKHGFEYELYECLKKLKSEGCLYNQKIYDSFDFDKTTGFLQMNKSWDSIESVMIRSRVDKQKNTFIKMLYRQYKNLKVEKNNKDNLILKREKREVGSNLIMMYLNYMCYHYSLYRDGMSPLDKAVVYMNDILEIEIRGKIDGFNYGKYTLFHKDDYTVHMNQYDIETQELLGTFRIYKSKTGLYMRVPGTTHNMYLGKELMEMFCDAYPEYKDTLYDYDAMNGDKI